MDTADFIGGIFLVIVALFFGFMCIVGAYGSGYREGQIEALNDRYTYKIVKQDDGTTKWKQVEKYSLKKGKK